MRINIIGGGLAGCSLAYVLKRAGAEPVIYEAGSTLASGASGNDVGLYNPRFTAEYDTVGQFYFSAFHAALEVFAQFGERVDWNPCGALHLMTDDKKKRRFPKMVEGWPWAVGDAVLVDADQASDIAGIKISSNCLYIEKSGIISPNKICHAYADNVEVHLDKSISDLSALDGDVTVIACGMGALSFHEAGYLPLKAVRGQVSYVEANGASGNLKTALCYGGYIAPAIGNVHCLGATFQRWLDHSDIIPQDNTQNIQKLSDAIPVLAGEYRIAGSRAAVRTTSRDHFPIVGEIGESLYISVAHGSHGILSSLQSSLILAHQILGAVPENVSKALSPVRFS